MEYKSPTITKLADVLRHKALDGLRFEKNVLKLILDNGIDDVLPLLDEGLKKRLTDYVDAVINNIADISVELQANVEERKNWERKEFALWVNNHAYKNLFFKVYDGNEPIQALRDYIGKNLSTQTTVDKLRPLLGVTW